MKNILGIKEVREDQAKRLNPLYTRGTYSKGNPMHSRYF